MNLNINLLKKYQAISPQLLKIAKIIRWSAISSLIIFILAVAIIFGFDQFSVKKNEEIKKRIDSAIRTIQMEKTTEGIYLSYLQKLSTIDTVTQNRFVPSDILRKLEKILPSGLFPSNLTLDPTNLNFAMEFPSLNSLEELISSFNHQKELPITQFTLHGLQKNTKTGSYTANLQIIMGK